MCAQKNKNAQRAWILATAILLVESQNSKCKFVLAKSPENVHKKFRADRSSIFRVTL